MRKEREYTVIDLFSGAGGLSLGLYQSGWHGLFAIEKNPFAFEILKFNLIDNKHHFNWPDWLPQTPHDINEVLRNYSTQLAEMKGTIYVIYPQGEEVAFNKGREVVKWDSDWFYGRYIIGFSIGLDNPSFGLSNFTFKSASEINLGRACIYAAVKYDNKWRGCVIKTE